MDAANRSTSSSRRQLPTGWLGNVLTLLAVVSAAAIIWLLAEQNRELRQALANNTPTPTQRLPEVGDRIPSVQLLSTDGRNADLAELTANGAVVAFLTTTCRFCSATLPVWTQLQHRLADLGVSFIAVSLDEAEATREFSEAEAIPWSLWATQEASGRSRLRVSAVPVTTFVAPGGEITMLWRGALGKEKVEEISTAVATAEARTGGGLRW